MHLHQPPPPVPAKQLSRICHGGTALWLSSYSDPLQFTIVSHSLISRPVRTTIVVHA